MKYPRQRLGFIQCRVEDFRRIIELRCMHSIKEAIIAREHEAETESASLHDLRTVGKG
jgi:hypothetical protein